MNWGDILPPPTGSGIGTFLTAVTHIDDKLVEIIDVEKVLDQVIGVAPEVSQDVLEGTSEAELSNQHILVVDDSSVARKQIKRTLDQVGVQCTLAKDGKEALGFLLDLAGEDTEVTEHLAVVISDVEMPCMDGYTLTTEIRKHEKLKNLYVILHTSLSGVFNQAMVERVGADEFIPKFDTDELATAVLKAIDQNMAKKHAA
jgi:two-component system chemotaxis response regulator CheV